MTKAKRSKLGCRTCKIRRVKCDEGRPACQTCLSTGRICDGYGIWGGGGNTYGQRMKNAEGQRGPCLVQRHPLIKTTLSATGLTTDESLHFDWFTHRSRPKLPGAFRTELWEQVMIQASVTEPAVLHAVLALSSSHRSDVVKHVCSGPTPGNELERFTLLQYSKAIKHLYPRLQRRDHETSIMALVACALFIHMENMLGRYDSSLIHLTHGLNILKSMYNPSGTLANSDCISLKSWTDCTNDWIIQTFLALDIQARILRNDYHDLLWSPINILTRQKTFHSPETARQELDMLLISTLLLTQQLRETKRAPSSNDLQQRIDILTRLNSWLKMVDETRSQSIAPVSSKDDFAYQLLCLYHTVTMIMTDVSIYADPECRYDHHTSTFISVLRQGISLFKKAPTHSTSHEPQGSTDSRSICDLGWIMPLYFTATKCRHHRIRLQAIRMLEMSLHKEGIWDSAMAASIAREAMQTEEGQFLADVELMDDFNSLIAPREEDLYHPLVPPSLRLRDLKIYLGHVGGQTLLRYRKGQKSHLKVYDPSTRIFTNASSLSNHGALLQPVGV
ncbi:hypothetical protein LTS17_011739 [Exophiala oligosperma]